MADISNEVRDYAQGIKNTILAKKSVMDGKSNPNGYVPVSNLNGETNGVLPQTTPLGGFNDDPDNGPGGGGGGGGYVAPRPAYTAAVLPSATSQQDYINRMYAANEAAKLSALRQSYDENMAALDQQAATIPQTYQQAENQAAAQAAINRANFNEYAAASGINTGAGSQARLAQDNSLLGNLSNIRREQANAQADIERQRVAYQKDYQNAIAAAIAANDAERAQALYAEARRVDDSLVDTAKNQAAENYKAWAAMYG